MATLPRAERVSMNENANGAEFASLTADVVSAYVSNNSVRPAELPDMIASVHQALQGLTAPRQAEPEKLQPAVPIKRSVTPDFIVSLEDGKHYKSLKRHLSGRGLTPDQYREKWGLPRDYPMVAPNYAKQRSELAKALGLGQIRRTSAVAIAAAIENDAASAQQLETPSTEGESTPKRRGRPRQKAAT